MCVVSFLSNCLISFCNRNLHGNKLSALPDSFEFMYSLTYLDLSSNEFTEIPEVLYYLPLDAYVFVKFLILPTLSHISLFLAVTSIKTA